MAILLPAVTIAANADSAAAAAAAAHSKERPSIVSLSLSRRGIVGIIAIVLIVVNSASLLSIKASAAGPNRSLRSLQAAAAANSVVPTRRSSSTTTRTNNVNNNNNKNDLETAVVILSNLIPTHPSLHMIQETLDSLKRLKGLSSQAPIYIMVDMLSSYARTPEQLYWGEIQLTPADRMAAEERLEAYVHNLYKEYNGVSNIHIVVNAFNKHIGGTMQKALTLLDPTVTKYVYHVQHDFKFVTDIDHAALVQTMTDDPVQYHMVRFNKRRSIHPTFLGCHNRTEVRINNITLTPTTSWSDNNHLASVEHYTHLLHQMVFVQRAPEGPMQRHASQNCSYWGQYIYGSNGNQHTIDHLDGRGTTPIATAVVEGAEVLQE